MIFLCVNYYFQLIRKSLTLTVCTCGKARLLDLTSVFYLKHTGLKCNSVLHVQINSIVFFFFPVLCLVGLGIKLSLRCYEMNTQHMATSRKWYMQWHRFMFLTGTYAFFSRLARSKGLKASLVSTGQYMFQHRCIIIETHGHSEINLCNDACLSP